MMRSFSSHRGWNLKSLSFAVVTLIIVGLGFLQLRHLTSDFSVILFDVANAGLVVLKFIGVIMCGFSAALVVAQCHFAALLPQAKGGVRLLCLEVTGLDPVELVALIPTPGLFWSKGGAVTQPATPAHGGRWPITDIDVTTATDSEDLIVFMADVVEFVSQDVTLLMDVCGEGLLGLAGLAWVTTKVRRILSSRLWKR